MEVTCQQFVELITDYLEGALRPRMLSLVEEHLVMCDWCVTYMEQLEETAAALRAGDQVAVPAPSESVVVALRSRRESGG